MSNCKIWDPWDRKVFFITPVVISSQFLAHWEDGKPLKKKNLSLFSEKKSIIFGGLGVEMPAMKPTSNSVPFGTFFGFPVS